MIAIKSTPVEHADSSGAKSVMVTKESFQSRYSRVVSGSAGRSPNNPEQFKPEHEI